MRTVGIIAEYNPFHKGHLRQIDYARQVLGADQVIVAMSGYFTQRGEPVLLPPLDRAQMALSSGADLILMLPSLYATSASIDYARAGVRLLAATGLIDILLFGTETEDLDLLRRAAHYECLLSPHNAGGRAGDRASLLQARLKESLRQGISYPKASRRLIAEALYEDRLLASSEAGAGRDLSPQAESAGRIEAVLSSPNNILAIDYLAAVEEEKLPWECALIRRNCDYHREDPPADSIASAGAIRAHVTDFSFLRDRMPEASARILIDRVRSKRYLLPEDMDPLYAYLLALLKADPPRNSILDLDTALRTRLAALAGSFTDSRSFIREVVSSKSYTWGRTSRALCHLLLNYRSEDKELLEQVGSVPYLRIIGLGRDAGGILGQLGRRASRLLLVRHADLQKLLASDSGAPRARAILRNYQMDLLAEKVYCSQLQLRCGQEILPILGQKLLTL